MLRFKPPISVTQTRIPDFFVASIGVIIVAFIGTNINLHLPVAVGAEDMISGIPIGCVEILLKVAGSTPCPYFKILSPHDTFNLKAEKN
jgi:hypothetical protein